MTILFKTGAWSSRTTTGTDVITGVGFTPKIMIFFSSADFNTDDTFGSDYNFRFGVATDTTAANQGGMASYSQDGNSGVANTDRLWNSGALVREVGGGPTIQGAVSAIGSDGFTVNWTLVDGTAHRINYICIGGTDITNVKSGILTTPTATGNVAYTGPGFTPDFLMVWTNQTTTAGSTTGSTLGIGYATSASNQAAFTCASQQGVNPMGTRKYQRGDNVICLVTLDPSISPGPNSAVIGGSLVSMDTNGFTINWSTMVTQGQSKSFGYLAVKGGGWKVGSSTSRTSVGTQSVTGVGFLPVGVILSSICQITSTGIGTGNRVSFGGSSGSASNRCIWTGDTTAVSTSVSAMIQKSAKCISMCAEAATATSSTVTAEAAMSTLDSGGFTLNWTTASASALEFLYVAIGPLTSPQNISVAPSSQTLTLTQNTPVATRTKAPKSVAPAAQSLTLTQNAPTLVARHNRTGAPAPESITLADTLTSARGVVGHNSIIKAVPQQILSLDDTASCTVTYGAHHITLGISQTLRLSDSLNYIGKTKHTGDPGYWLPIKARINIYAFTDTTYSSPLYTYNAFTDGLGGTDKPIALQFESSSTSAGTFQLQIDNSADTYDLDQFARGNRVTIDCSKDNITWSTAYHGLVRSVRQKIFGPNNRIIFIEGYSYLIRLSERVIDTKLQSRLNLGVFDRTDTTMFSDNLINTLLTDDTKYINSVDDTQLYSVFKTSNITASPIDDWVPRLDAQMATLNEAINSVLEFSVSLIEIDFNNDQIVLFNPDRTPSGGVNAFLVTDAMNLLGDSSANTMYPIEDYSYQISYDFPDSANRLIAAIGNVQCPEQVIPGQQIPGQVGSAVYTNVISPPGSVGGELYRAWQVDNFVGVPISATRVAISIQDASLYTKVLSRISVAIRVGAGITGSIQVGIRKASDDSFISFGVFDIASVPRDSLYHGYDFTNLANTYGLVQFDHVSVEDAGLSAAISVGVAASGATTVPLHSFISGSWTLASGYVLTAVLNENVVDTTNWGTIKLNGGTVQRVSVLVNSTSGLRNYKLGRLALWIRTGGTTPNGTYWVGIRKTDNTFIYFGTGVYDTTTFHPEDNTFREYFYDNLNNNYPIQTGDRISIEVSGMTTGYLEFEFSKNAGSGETVQTWNGTSWVTTGITSFKMGATFWTTTAEQLPDVTIDPCGGPPETVDADPILQVCNDRNGSKRIGQIEQLISNLPPHVKNITTLNEYMFNKSYLMAKPRFTFDYPSLTLPAVMPKAGDICVHVSKKARVGIDRYPLQTGVISSVTYDFGQDSDSILGLRKVSLSTTGIVRGSY